MEIRSGLGKYRRGMDGMLITTILTSSWAVVSSVFLGVERHRRTGASADIDAAPNNVLPRKHQGGPVPRAPQVFDWTFVVTGRGTINLWDVEIHVLAGTPQTPLPSTSSLTPDTKLPSFMIEINEHGRIAFEVLARQSRLAKLKTVAKYDSSNGT